MFLYVPLNSHQWLFYNGMPFDKRGKKVALAGSNRTGLWYENFHGVSWAPSTRDRTADPRIINTQDQWEDAMNEFYISRNHLQRWNLGKGRYQLWSWCLVICVTSSRNGGRDRTVYFKESSPEMEPWKRQEPALELIPCHLRYQLQKWCQR